MNDHQRQLDAAIRNFNEAERTTFTDSTMTVWLGLDGPVYQVGDVRVKAFFVDPLGRHWVDAALYAESLNQGTGATENVHTSVCHPDVEGRDLWVMVDVRGKWNAVVTPVTVLACELGHEPPTLRPAGDWARTWWDLPGRTDAQELAWIANGGDPTQLHGRNT